MLRKWLLILDSSLLLFLFHNALCLSTGYQEVAAGRFRRQSNDTDPAATETGWIEQNWPWALLLILVVIMALISMACILTCCWCRRARNKEKNFNLEQSGTSRRDQLSSTLSNFRDSSQQGPPSPQLSSSSLHSSYEKGRRKGIWSGHSSESEEGLKARDSRSSLNSSLASVRLTRTDNTQESSRSGRRKYGSSVQILDDSNISLMSAPSSTSVHSISHRSDVSQSTVVEIKVIVPQSAPSREREVQQATAAALAESAAKLAQSAATIGEEDLWRSFEKRSNTWQMRFHTFSDSTKASHSSPAPATSRMHGPLHPGESFEGQDGTHEDLLNDPLYQLRMSGSSRCKHPVNLVQSVPRYQNGSLPQHIFHSKSLLNNSPSSSVHQAEITPNLVASPYTSHKKLVHHTSLRDQAWERRRVGHYGSYSPPHRKSDATQSTIRNPIGAHQNGSMEGRELKPLRIVPPNGSEMHPNDDDVFSPDRQCHNIQVVEVEVMPKVQSHLEPTSNDSTTDMEVRQHITPQSNNPSTSTSPDHLTLHSQQPTPGYKSKPLEGSHRHRRPSVHSLIGSLRDAEKKTSPSRSASTDNLCATEPFPEGPAFESSKSAISKSLSKLKRQASMPNFKNPPAAAGTARSSHSLARTTSGLSVSGMESTISGYLASAGSSSTLGGGDPGQESLPTSPLAVGSSGSGNIQDVASLTMSPAGLCNEVTIGEAETLDQHTISSPSEVNFKHHQSMRSPDVSLTDWSSDHFVLNDDGLEV